MRRSTILAALVAGALVPSACGPRSETRTVAMDVDPQQAAQERLPESTLTVESAAFGQGDAIPVRYTADGENVSPPLSWNGGPAGAVVYALVVDDPDSPAGTWVHWVMWNEPNTHLDENVRTATPTPSGAVQGKNSWQRTGYGGPQPPSGTHRYFFRVYALDTRLDLGANAGRAELDAAMRDHILASGELMGRYARKL